MTRSAALQWAIILGTGALFANFPEAASAGEVAGRVVLSRPPAIEATLGLSPGQVGGFPGPAVADRVAAGPVLIYVAESEVELPRTPTPGARVRLSGGKGTPSLVAVSLGSVVTFESADRREHRMRSRSGPLRFDLGRQLRGQTRELRADQTGIIVFECALHGDMRGEIVVLANAAFAIADASGNYRLRDLPPGRATIVAYAPHFGEVSRQVLVGEKETAEVEFAF